MLKTLAILAFVCIAVVAMPAHNQVVSSRTPSQRQQDAQKTPAPSVAPITNNQSTAYYQQEGKEKPQGWHKFVAWPEGITALAIVFTFFAIVWQSIWTQLSVRASRDSIRLQESAYSQWIALSNWSVKYREDRGELDIHVEILNQTAFPLILNRAQITFGDKPNTATATLNEDYFLAPQIPYVIERGLHTYNDQLRAFDAGYFGIMVEGSITHTGTLKRPQTQDIGGILIAARDQPASFSAFIPMHPKESAQVDDTQE